MSDFRVVTIDGPSASGKSTVARLVAERTGRFHVESGALYRGVAWQALAQGIPLEEGARLVTFLDGLQVEMVPEEVSLRFRLNGQLLGDQIRTPAVSAGASAAGKIPAVRNWVNAVLRRTPQKGNVVVDGRDIGTAVFPEARYKFFLEADLETRARRRFAEWRNTGLSFEQVLRETADRDRQDRERSLAPLLPASDAVIIDTSALSAEQVAERIVAHLKDGGNSP